VGVSVADVGGSGVGEGRRGHDFEFLEIHYAKIIATLSAFASDKLLPFHFFFWDRRKCL
jgi:hypothetical protein